jgi:hypothetical protein
LLTAALKNCNPFYCFLASQLWRKGKIAVELRKSVITNFMTYALRLKNFLLLVSSDFMYYSVCLLPNLNYFPDSKSFQTFGRIIFMGHRPISMTMVSEQTARQ